MEDTMSLKQRAIDALNEVRATNVGLLENVHSINDYAAWEEVSDEVFELDQMVSASIRRLSDLDRTAKAVNDDAEELECRVAIEGTRAQVERLNSTLAQVFEAWHLDPRQGWMHALERTGTARAQGSLC